jgi:DNA (cytosine-5)-methyltransferase 1
MHSRNQSVNFIDLFAGAGGLSEGFVQAGFFPIAHIDMDNYACQTIRTRACFHFLKASGQIDQYRRYLRKEITKKELYKLVPERVLRSIICETMSDKTIDSIFSRIDFEMHELSIDHVDLIVGGPPCQSYSLVGRSRISMDNDPRNKLYKQYFRMINRYQPQMFVFENVPGILSAGNGAHYAAILEKAESLGYDMEQKVLTASDYGVLQNRKRVMIVGWKYDSKFSFPELKTIENKWMVKDILEDLPFLRAGESSSEYRSADFSTYLRETGLRTDKDVLTWHLARPHNERDQSIYQIAVEKWNKDRERLLYTDLPPELMTHRNKTGFLDRYKVVAGDISTSHTLTAHISKDGHYYIHPDIKQVRSLSVREAARIQSFPDNFYFEGPRTSVFSQIGNAVPPLMAKAIAEALLSQY